MNAKKIAIALLTFGAWLAPASQAAAEEKPAWQLSVIPLPTNFAPGEIGTTTEAPLYSVVATNLGTAATSGAIGLTAKLPVGLTPVEVAGRDGDLGVDDPSCSTDLPTRTITCASEGPVHPGRWLGAAIAVEVAPTASGVLSTEASVGGGGALTVSTVSSTQIASGSPGFGFLPGDAGLRSLLTNEDGFPTVQAGSRPAQMTVDLGFTSEHVDGFPVTGAGHPRDLATDLPPGFIVNPAATPVKCTEAQLTGAQDEGCPDASQVGIVTITTSLPQPTTVSSGLYNMVPSPGVAAELGFNALNVGVYVHLGGKVRNDDDYGLSAIANDILSRTFNPVLAVQAQLWGDPTRTSYDRVRGEKCRLNSTLSSCSVDPQDKPLMSMPSACSGPLTTVVRARSWEEPDVEGLPHEAQSLSEDYAGNPVGVNGCSVLDFKPTLTVQPEATTAETPTALHAHLHIPQDENEAKRATSNLRDTTVTFPKGIALNPAAAGGLAACTPAQVGLTSGVGVTPARFSLDPAQCPDNSKIGKVEVHTPLLDHPLPGSVYVAQPYENPFGTLLGVYIAVHDPQTDVVAKLAGRTEIIDEATGQLQTTFADNPQVPVEDFKVDLFGGPRAALRTPAVCGGYTTESVHTPWSGTAPVSDSDTFLINEGANGSACLSSENEAPNNPGFQAGTLIPIAGEYSPFVLRLTRGDGSQQFESLNMTLPPGLSGKIAGTPACPDGALVAAESKTGNEELASPSCPAASQVGQVTVGAGAGPEPYHTTGKIYLAGPYKGAPLSAAIVVPAVAGPFDLGTVVVRAALYVNSKTAQITAKSDPAPRVLEGIPLNVRSIAVDMNKPKFTLNPTSCEEMAIQGEEISIFGNVAPLANPFGVGGCRGLDFKPKLSLRLLGGTKRGAHPRLRAVLTAKPGEANTARAIVALPRTEFLDQAHIRTVCTRVQFAADACPRGSIYGNVRAFTPLLDEALEGPVYLRSSDNELPDMVAVLKGPPSRPIEIEAVARIDSIKGGGIRANLETVPDAPVSKVIVTMQGGNKGLLINSANLCKVKRPAKQAKIEMDAHSGKVNDFNPVVKNDCGKRRKGNRPR